MADVASAPVLSIKDLTVRFGQYEAVKGISFNVAQGETVALVGESGSGKSVTALSIMRLLPESAFLGGEIHLSGQDMMSLREADLRAMRGGQAGMIFQEPMTSLNPVLTVGFQVSEAFRYHGDYSQSEADAEALRLFERVRIPDGKKRFGQYPHTFSGGMRQRIMIAMALACRPRLLIADEPTTALDVTVQAEILNLLADLQRETNTAVLFITHDMGVVAEVADRVVVMRYGKVVEDRTVEDLFAEPGHDYTRQLLSAVPRLGDMRGENAPRRFGSPTPHTERLGPGNNSGGTSRSKPAALSVERLTTRFPVRGGILGRVNGYVHAVENVSFTVAPNETLSLVGESGCGKSTTGRSILRLVEPTAGAVRFDGQDLLSTSGAALQEARRRIQMIFQDPFGSLDPRQTVGSAIAEPILVHGHRTGAEARDRVAHLMERVGLSAGHASRFPHEFSGGQRQRICIARALALEPSFIIADEAVSALDVSIKAQVIDLLLDLQEEFGLSYLFISHDMAIVERVSHRVAVMLLGRIVEIGPRSAVIENPQHPYTRKLLAAVPIPDPSLRRIKSTGARQVDELKSPIRPLGYTPTPQRFHEVTPGHFVEEI
ncbi:ABC transporter ATP-binding protein [Microvirga pudoricolor]|uniref:ABC transporter ATP-binding protein n=1 Tax=Microvirga pudoricolor TaxID=2778729 RepID=UPI001951A801|nr:ABC transporter ATP-binding protein [Microvirga pudoricolor]MBM6595134.1 ABC transporter ATP-binding protein [Microvirga pudoricolor]